MTGSTRTLSAMMLALGVAASHAPRTEAFSAVRSRGAAQTSPSSEKDTRTPAQQKINSQLLYEIYRVRGQAKQKGIPSGRTDVRIDTGGRALVDVRATPVTEALQKKIRGLGGTILSISAEHHSVVAWTPLLKLERLAEDATVRFIEPAAEGTTVRPSTEK